MNPIFDQSHLDADLSWTFEGQNNSVEAFFSVEGLSIQKRLLYLFLYNYILIA